MNGGGPYLLTIDAGTGSGRAILFDASGNEVASVRREWVPTLDPRYPGAQDFDTKQAWQLICECIREVLQRGPVDPQAIAAVTATSMREGMVLYDREGREIWACPNVDARATQEAAEMSRSGLAATIYATGGDWVNITSPPRFWWLRRHVPEVANAVAHMTMISDWVLYRLSGEFVTEPSVGSSSGLFDLRKRTWSPELIEIADMPTGIYPKVVESGQIIGRVTPDAAQRTGLVAGTPVVTSGADTQLGLVGVGNTNHGQYAVIGGTFWQTTLVVDRPIIDPEQRLRTLCHSVPGRWMVEGIGFYHGFVMRWFREAFCTEEVSRASLVGRDPYELMEEKAALVPPGSNGVFAIFSNVMDSKAWKHAPPSLAGFDILHPSTSGKKECIRAIEESAAYVTRAHFAILREISHLDTESLVFAGGSAKGFLWPTIVSSVLNRRLHLPVVKESPALGGALWAGVAVGLFPSIQDAVQRTVRFERTVEPKLPDAAAYEEHYRKWRELYPHFQAIGDDGLLPSLWRAPGV